MSLARRGGERPQKSTNASSGSEVPSVCLRRAALCWKRKKPPVPESRLDPWLSFNSSGCCSRKYATLTQTSTAPSSLARSRPHLHSTFNCTCASTASATSPSPRHLPGHPFAQLQRLATLAQHECQHNLGPASGSTRRKSIHDDRKLASGCEGAAENETR